MDCELCGDSRICPLKRLFEDAGQLGDIPRMERPIEVLASRLVARLAIAMIIRDILELQRRQRRSEDLQTALDGTDDAPMFEALTPSGFEAEMGILRWSGVIDHYEPTYKGFGPTDMHFGPELAVFPPRMRTIYQGPYFGQSAPFETYLERIRVLRAARRSRQLRGSMPRYTMQVEGGADDGARPEKLELGPMPDPAQLDLALVDPVPAAAPASATVPTTRAIVFDNTLLDD